MEGVGEGVVVLIGGSIGFGLFWKFGGVDVGIKVGGWIVGLGGRFSGDEVGLGIRVKGIGEGEIVWVV